VDEEPEADAKDLTIVNAQTSTGEDVTANARTGANESQNTLSINSNSEEILSAVNEKNTSVTGANVQAAIGNELAGAEDVTARTPNTETTKQNIEETHSKSSEHGAPGPLENENDKPIREESKSSNYDQTSYKRQNKADTEQTNIPAPLAEGIKPERFRADQLMRQATHETPVKAENLFQEMISRIDMMKTDAERTMTIQLKPEFLGKVALELVMDAAGLHLRIDAANSDVRAMINGQLTALIQSLEQKGIEVVEVEVTHTGVDNGAYRESRGGHAHNGNRAQSGRTRELHPLDRTDYFATLAIDTVDYYLDDSVSSVEFSA
jgi:flagellar hook-length control protein FliK